jgi:hypothetical protein
MQPTVNLGGYYLKVLQASFHQVHDRLEPSPARLDRSPARTVHASHSALLKALDKSDDPEPLVFSNSGCKKRAPVWLICSAREHAPNTAAQAGSYNLDRLFFKKKVITSIVQGGARADAAPEGRANYSCHAKLCCCVPAGRPWRRRRATSPGEQRRICRWPLVGVPGPRHLFMRLEHHTASHCCG